MKSGRRNFLRGLGAGVIGVLAGVPARAAGARELPSFDAADPERYWSEARTHYPLLPAPAYLNCGGLGPAPASVLEAVDAASRRLQEHCEHGREEFEPARAAVAGFIGALPEETCFVRNATEGNSIIAAGLALSAGDEVIFETHAHPGGSFPWLNEAKRRGIVVRLFEPDATSAEANVVQIRELITSRTRVIQVSHITCTTGLVFPVAAIAGLARPRGIWFHVDGAQAAGMIPLDIHALGCDSYAFSGHKWIGGPHETGVLFIRRDRLEDVACSGAGAHTGDLPRLPGVISYAGAASRHEYGTRSTALVAGLAEAVRWHERLGRERIASRGRELAERIRDGLSGVAGIEVLTPRAAALRGSITTFRHERAGAHTLFGYLMKEHKLRCRPVTEQGLEAIRVSTHVFNSPAESDRVVAAVRAASRAF
ncbi:MAG TPA: aminotransferase class V-fold PLP-dependent enzyme [Opitutaceae bacterium]|nr:aminotransferase class V-fold PLP-dependent enzyme [Opitutaceae bacterium]